MATAPSPAPAPEKSPLPLHNFPLTFLKWGSKNHHPHRFRRGSPSSSASPPPRRPNNHPSTATTTADPEEGEKACWNLRPRRPPPPPSPAVKAPMLSVEREAAASAATTTVSQPKATATRAARVVDGEKRKLWISLSREEIEEDIYSFTGSRPSRRPRKRPRNLQKQIDNVFPGLWLVGISPEANRGLDLPPKVGGKKGLSKEKQCGSFDS